MKDKTLGKLIEDLWEAGLLTYSWPATKALKNQYGNYECSLIFYTKKIPSGIVIKDIKEALSKSKT